MFSAPTVQCSITSFSLLSNSPQLLRLVGDKTHYKFHIHQCQALTYLRVKLSAANSFFNNEVQNPNLHNKHNSLPLSMVTKLAQHWELSGVRLKTKLCTARISVTSCAQPGLLHYRILGVSCVQFRFNLIV